MQLGVGNAAQEESGLWEIAKPLFPHLHGPTRRITSSRLIKEPVGFKYVFKPWTSLFKWISSVKVRWQESLSESSFRDIRPEKTQYKEQFEKLFAWL